MSSNQDQLHVIVGGGVIGAGVAAELNARGLRHVTGSRRPAADELHVQLDALDAESLLTATQGASHIYLTMGLKYDITVWRQDWPRIMSNAIAAAKANHAKLIFFDNIYMYGPSPLQNPITEEHPQSPITLKGKLRKQIADQLLNAATTGEISGLIGRSADFYGPGATNSPLYYTALKALLAGKAPLLIAPPDIRHSYTYTTDASRGLVELALDDTAYGQVWHLPTASPALTDAQNLESLAQLTGTSKRPNRLPRAAMGPIGLFVPILREVKEMLYQYDGDYIFSSAKFEAKYPNFKITPYDEGLAAMVSSFRAQR